ncbi:JmjC domain-containing protein [Pseudoalteromonas fenneropenaei]|uniref:JmjC domain-containing protein n=1 Tax=Pseudoalteromonas fenneropenaei TaxID=1737459 RepID=A0ABV7CF82_9GAMM
MYELSLNGMSVAEFLANYWQKKPLLIKGGFTDFQDPIEPEELAGLAMEDSIESRLVTNHNNDWQAYHGPFEDFSLLTERNSTLLVQAVDHWHPDSAALLEPFRFIPNWRIDDLMISYSTPGGGVGPHLDQYDVFIIQGMGKRHWRVGLPNPTLKEFAQNKSLLQVEQFEACIDEVLQPGDILYIPPGHPHEGYAVENALNYSVGFRAANQRDLLSNFADYLIDNEAGKLRYSDANLTERPSCGELLNAEASAIAELMIAAIHNQQEFKHWLGKNMSTPKHDMDLCPLDEPFDVEELADILSDDVELCRAGGTRAIYQRLDEQQLLLSVNGENYSLPSSELHNVKLLCDNTELSSDQFENSQNWLEFVQTLATLINEGIFYFPE